MITNFPLIKKLKKKVENERIRQKIIFLDTFIGSYKARSDKQKFLDFEHRRITSDVYEAEYIAEKRHETLKLLEEKSPTEVLEQLIKEASDLQSEEISQQGLYSYFKYFKNNEDLMCRAGKRLETRIINNGERLKEKIRNRTRDNGLIERILYYESDSMIGALFYELQ
mgnify:CR=1 FL=1